MVAFATGRILSTGDKMDSSVTLSPMESGTVRPVSNTQLLTQTLTTSTYGSDDVRTVTANVPDWSDGHIKAGKSNCGQVSASSGERPFYNNGRFYFLATNPTVDMGENWLHRTRIQYWWFARDTDIRPEQRRRTE